MDARQSALPDAIPMISYEDAKSAIDWLTLAFGFSESNRMTDETGRITHAELRLGGAVIFIASPTQMYQGPRRHAESCEAARAWQSAPWVIDGVLIFVDDVRAHFAAAAAAGAAMLSVIEEGFPGTRYRVEDCEGHRWMFMQRA